MTTTETLSCVTGPRQAITQERLIISLKKDKGNEAELISWEVKDFLKPGQNMCCYVTSVAIKYSLQGENKNVSYILKLNPSRNSQGYNDFMLMSFMTEEKFFTKVASNMRAVLESAGVEPLNIPKCFYSSKEPNQMMILMEDLREQGYIMRGYEKGIDVAHTSLVLEAIARFHASYFLLKKRTPDEDLSIRYDPNDASAISANNVFQTAFLGGIECCYALLRHAGGHEKAVKWLDKLRKGSNDHNQEDSISKISPSFEAICHSDLYCNNMLFRYDDNGNPTDFMFVDLQVATLGSLAQDLQYILLVNLPFACIKTHESQFVNTYYNAYRTTAEAGGEAMPFTMHELLQEMKKRRSSPLKAYMIRVPLIVNTSNMDANEFFRDKNRGELEEVAQKAVTMYKANPNIFKEIVDTFDDMEKEGVFD